MRLKLLILLVILAALAAAFFKNSHHSLPIIGDAKSTPTASQPAGFNKDQYPTDVASSLWVVVNKGRVLPANYVPANLVAPTIPLNGSGDNMEVRSDTAKALGQMATAAKADGINFKLVSGYRSYYTQASLYNSYVASQGQAYADSSSAKAGHSEHQTGLAADLGATSGQCDLDQCFGDTTAGKWLVNNSYKYGFVIRYEKGKENVTGYEYEPWHVRYVGTDLAVQLHQAGQALEQYFGLPYYTDYPATSLQLKTD